MNPLLLTSCRLLSIFASYSTVLSATLLFDIQSTCAQAPTISGQVDFARDIQPILTSHCWSCHGPDEKSRKADLRLDVRDAAIAASAIVPMDIHASQLIDRVNAADPDLVMPPPETKKPLSERQKELLQAWIGQGASYSGHWSFETPSRPDVPVADGIPNTSSPIDRFIRAGLLQAGIQPAGPADRSALLRRVSLDLTGLPPSVAELEAFLADTSPNAYENMVDRLLSSKAYAERMAALWLDLARYADTNGYNNDEDRTMWPWRDWVIDAFDRNMPYDRFLVEQLAGDLLPNPSQSQLVATAFLRNQGHNTEGGIIEEEYRVEYVADRVHTTATVFLGLSMQCARCHDHKYDPISQAEYYQFFAMFNNLEEKQASYSKFVAVQPFLRVPSESQQLKMLDLDREIEVRKQQLSASESRSEETLRSWLSEHTDAQVLDRLGCEETNHLGLDRLEPAADSPGTLVGMDSHHPDLSSTLFGNVQWSEGHLGQAVELDGDSYLAFNGLGNLDAEKPFSMSVWLYPIATGDMAVASKMDEADSFRGYDLLLENGKVAMHMVHHWPDDALKVSTQQTLSEGAWHHVAVSYDGSKRASGLRIYLDGELAKLDTHQDSLRDSIATDKPFHLGRRQVTLPFRGRIDELRIFSGTLLAENVDQLHRDQPWVTLTDWVRKPLSELSPERADSLRSMALHQLDPEYSILRKELAEKEKTRESLVDSLPAVMIMKEMQPARETFVLRRGQYDQPSDPVESNVPAILRTFSDHVPRNRLELAEWLVHPKHPLTARVAVNRFWEMFFGTGLVKTVEDFGVTGEYPSHPELLDYLAREFVDSGWDTKGMIKRIVMSAAYQQDSHLTPDRLAQDPENRLLARGPRYRLSAELIRDNALAISGLLQTRIGGPSVKPYQPDGLWEDVTVERRGKYVADSGEGLHRRSMYTFWKRTCPPPSMVSFDAPNREVCVARRSRTNTPLQSLVLLNDPTYVEAARALAEQMLLIDSSEDEARLDIGYQRCVARKARADERPVVLDLLNEARRRFHEAPSLAEELNRVGTRPSPPQMDPLELAAWTVVASTLLNLDETISKR